MDTGGWNSHKGRGFSHKRTISHTRVENEEEINEIFNFGRQLGQGSFGKVVEAINRATNSKFAVKSINKEKVCFYLYFCLYYCSLILPLFIRIGIIVFFTTDLRISYVGVGGMV